LIPSSYETALTARLSAYAGRSRREAEERA